MAHHVEPMDVDCMDSDFDNKENTYHHSNVLPCTEKGYEELDVSELNMKLRYSMTPAASPMSKSYTASLDNRNFDVDESLNSNNGNLTRSLNSTMTKNDSVIKSLKSLPLQSLPTEKFVDGNGNTSVLRQLESTITNDANVTVTVSGTNDADENLSLPSSSSSVLHTPEATTPTKEMTKDGASPIMRGLKSVLNMFRSSQSPIPPLEGHITVEQEAQTPADVSISENTKSQAVASTPIATHRTKDGNTSKRSSPYKDSIVFNDDLETELNWKDETTILFSEEKIPVHKLFFQQGKSLGCKSSANSEKNEKQSCLDNLNSTVEFMDISYNESMTKENTMTVSQTHIKNDVNATLESDSEFVDCETTFTKNESLVLNVTEGKNILSVPKAGNPDVVRETNQAATLANELGVSDITSMSFANEEHKYDASGPSECSDYSKETAELLSELEKFEENLSSKVESSDTHANSLQDNIAQKINIIDQQSKSHEVTTNITLDGDIVTDKNIMTETQINKLNIHKQVTDLGKDSAAKEQKNFAQSKEPKTNTSEPVMEKLHHLESNLANENKVIQPIETTANQVNNNEAEVLSIITPCPQMPADASEEIIETVCVQDLNNTGIPKITDISTSLISAENKEFLSKINLDMELSELYNVENKIMPETINAEQTVGKSLFLEEYLKESTDIGFSEFSKMTPCKITSEVNVVMTDKPSDIPLPDEDDMDKEVIIDEVVAIAPILVTPSVRLDNSPTKLVLNQDNLLNTSVEHEIANSSVLLEMLNKTNFEKAVIQVPEVIESENTESDLNALTFDEKPEIENNSNCPEVLITPTETKNIPLLQDPANMAENVEDPNSILKLAVTENNAVKSSDYFLRNKIESGIVLSETNVEKSTQIPFAATVSSLDVTETLKDSICQNPPDSEISDNISLPKVVSVNDVTQAINVSGMSTHDVTMTDDLSNQTQNETDDIEPMDITMNESVNQTHVVPNLINQTVVFFDEDSQNSTKLINSEDSKDSSLKEPLLQLENVDNIVNIKDCDISKQEEIEANIEITDSNTALNLTDKNVINNEFMSLNNHSVEQNEKSVDHESQCLIMKSPTGNDNKSDIPLEVCLPDQISNDTDIKECHEQPTKTCNENEVTIDITTVDEEITVSGNNSPYVSLMTNVNAVPTKNIEETFEEIEKQSVANIDTPSSPPITSRGYNFNFDDMDDPFATKTKIRLSPPVDTPTKPIDTEKEIKIEQFEEPKRGITNRRKSQPPERKKPVALKKKFNASFDINNTSKTSVNKSEGSIDNIKDIQMLNINETITKLSDTTEIIECSKSNKTATEEYIENAETRTTQKPENSLKTNEENNIATISNEVKTTSSSEQSTYYSASASSSDSLQSKNVFNIPEIDDVNFNPFSTKSKMRMSPPPDMGIENPFASNTKMRKSPLRDLDDEILFAAKTKIRSSLDSAMISPTQLDSNSTATINEAKLAQLVDKLEAEDKMETELMEKDFSANTNNTAESCKNTPEVNTEDEDTEEGPFLDADIIDKIDFDAYNVDMMQVSGLPTQVADDNIEGGEMFIDAEAFELLLNQKSNMVADSGKESLFLKFDPLFAKRISADGVLAALSKVQKRQSTPTKPVRPSLRNEASPIAGPSHLNITYEDDNNVSQESNPDGNTTVSKPMMVVTPAVNPAVTPRNKSLTPTESNRRSVTFTSPAIAVIDRLLSMSANNSLMGQDTTMMHFTREQNEAGLALTQLRELLAEKEISVFNLRSESKELKDRLATMESQVRILEADGQERLRKIKDLNERLTEKTNINKHMAAVVEEYERTIARLIDETEQDKKRNAEERTRLIKERDEQTAHLASMEVSFNDLHSKYEKSKQVILACKANEDVCKKSFKDFEENLSKMQTNYEMLKQHASSKLNHANQELEKINRAHEAEVVKLNAMIKRKDLHIKSLEETLTQKTKANEELTAICDELINKVG